MILETLVDPDQIYARLETAPRVLAVANLPGAVETVLLSGSFAHGRADPLSDVDVHVLPADNHSGKLGHGDLWAVEDLLRRHLGTDEVYLDWIRPNDVSGLLARDLAAARVLFTRNGGRFRSLKARLFPDGNVPALHDVVRATSLSRAYVAISERHPLPSALARRCLNLGHEAIRTLGLPIPDKIEGIPGVLLAANIVRRREAEWVLWQQGLFHRPWDDDAWRSNRNGLSYGVDLGRDFAWHTLNALERAYFEQLPSATSGLD